VLVTALIEKLQAKYVFPDVARKMAETLREREARGEYKGVSRPEWCELVTRQLQEVCRDLHLQVRYSKEVLPPAVAEDGRLENPFWRNRQAGREYNFGFVKVERLAGNVGYLDVRAFYPPELAAGVCHGAMAFLANTSALVLDLRRNTGGEPGMVSILLSYLFAGGATRFVDFHWRESGLQQMWALPDLPGERYLDKPVYVLTSRKTFSGGEACAFDLQRLGRAKVIGEQTAGGAHPAEDYRLGDHVHVLIPVCRAADPVTGENWEGVGVTPDLQVPAERALETALRLAWQELLTDAERHPGKYAARTVDDLKQALGV
jgi:C-terminal processing protease CtpA/Prc